VRRPDLRIGIDVGGTNTDAAVLDRNDAVLAWAKAPTTRDVTGGIRTVLERVLSAAEIDRARVTHVMLGTTHATNAVLERRRLKRVGVLRLGAPATRSVPPLMAWPEDLRQVVSAGEAIVGGGSEFDGRELAPFDRDAAARFLESVAGTAEAVAVTGVFSPVSAEHERAARDLSHELLGEGVAVSLSHEVGSLGLIERENATVLNAALAGVAQEVAAALEQSLADHGLAPTVYFAQNDGTLMGMDYAIRYPVLTIGSGPANSLRGAAFLTGYADALVADVGGTSTDVGVLVGGFPRESSAAVEIGGIRTNFRMPDVLAVALGGGTRLRAGAGGVTLGPDSVGFELSREALVFGGDTPTLTDAAVAAGRAEVGEHRPPAELAELLRGGLAAADALLADAIDRVKVGRGDRPLVVVGGGSVLLPEAIPGVSEILRPAHYDVANAIGAAIARASGRWEAVVHLDGDRTAAIEAAAEKARDRAVQAGADPSTVEIVELDEVPLAYLDRPTVRVSVKAAGPLSWL
jgi:N-methylhydantoinase A/oxoprolinase/acetone carboxylase beta subunit